MEHHYYNAAHQKLLDLGLEPHLLGEELVTSVLKTIESYKDRVIPGVIEPKVLWNPNKAEAVVD